MAGKKKGKFGARKASKKAAGAEGSVANAKRLLRTNLFRAQVDELLSQMAENIQETDIEKHLREIYDAVKTAPSCTVDADFQKRFPQMHFFSETRRNNLEFVAPESLEIVGSFLLKTSVSKSVDLVAFLPESIFQSKDHINYRYGIRRNFFQQMYWWIPA